MNVGEPYTALERVYPHHAAASCIYVLGKEDKGQGEETGAYSVQTVPCRLVFLKLQSLDQPHQYPLGFKMHTPGPSPQT